MDYRGVRNKVEELVSKGVRIGVRYSHSELKTNPGRLVSAESELTVTELIGKRLNEWGGITLQPQYAWPTDVDLDVRHQGVQYSVQVKTFSFVLSRFSKRVDDAVSNWDVMLPQGQNAYVARQYRGEDLVAESIRPVKGVSRVARAGAFHFEPSSDDFIEMREKVISCLRDADIQLSGSPGLHIVLFDVRLSYIDSWTLYQTVVDIMSSATICPSADAVAILTYSFERGLQAASVMAPIWIKSLHERSMWFFRPPHPIRLVKARPFVMPLHVYFERPGWQNLLALEKGSIKIDDVEYGSIFDETA
jgi:hypothetical protein